MEFFNRVFHPRFVLPLSTFGALVGGTLLLKDLSLCLTHKWCNQRIVWKTESDRDHYGGDRCPSDARVDGKTIIVTGSNSGIGKETALELAKRGGRVILACRDVAKAEKTREEIEAASGNKDVKVLHLDLASLSSIRQFAETVKSDEDGVHILINNAGIMRCPKWKTEDGFEMQFGVNHLGHFYLTNLLLDKLQSSAPSRVINVSSVAHQVGKLNFEDIHSEERYNSAEAYADSKLANVLFTRQLSKRLKGTGVTANVLHPGVVKTNIGRHTGMHQSGFSMAILGPIFWLFVKSPLQGAQTSIYCAVDPELKDVSGQYFKDCKQCECGEAGKDDEAAAKLWDVSCQLTGLSLEETKGKPTKSQHVAKGTER